MGSRPSTNCAPIHTMASSLSSPSHTSPMKAKTLLLLGMLAPLTACATHHSAKTTGSLAFQPVTINDAARAELLGTLTALEGNWSTEGGDTTQFEVSSGGSVVREILFEGQPHEMTNMYTLDGNGLAMTHYCGMGNQPHMRATSLKDGRMVFAPTGVSDRKQADELYMATMTLTLIDEDTIEQSWTSYVGTEPGEDTMVFRYMRTD